MKRLAKQALNIITSILIKEGLRETRHTKGEGNVTTEAKIGVMWSQSKE